jgi:hypothetical protein
MENCRAIKKDKLPCENKGKEKHGGRCGIHKNYGPKIVEIKKEPLEIKTLDEILLEALSNVPVDIGKIIINYIREDHDTMYMFGDKKILKLNEKSERKMKYLDYKEYDVDPYFLWPDGKLNFIKINNIVKSIDKFYGDDNSGIVRCFLSNNFYNVSTIIIDSVLISPYNILITFKADGKVCKESYNFDYYRLKAINLDIILKRDYKNFIKCIYRVLSPFAIVVINNKYPHN